MPKMSSLIQIILHLFLVLLYFRTGNAQCFGQLTLSAELDNKQQIKSPNYPNNYNNNARCQWLITATSGSVFLKVESMQVENNYDYVYIYDGSSSAADLLGLYSPTTDVLLHSTGSALFILFTSDSSITRSGFLMTFFAVYSNTDPNYHPWPVSSCGSNISITTTQVQQLVAPDAPYLSYTSAITNCEVTVITTGNYLNVTLLWSDLYFAQDSQTSNGCEQNYGLSIWEGTGTSLLLSHCYAGELLDKSIVIYPSESSVMFRYNNPSPARGPVISIKAYSGSLITATVPVLTTQSVTSICGSVTLTSTSTMQYLSSPNYPANYDNSLSCRWMITTDDPTNSIINISIVSLYTEEGYDFLKVFDGPSSDYNLLTLLSGTHFTVDLSSSGAQLTLYFTTDSSIVNTGFYMSYINTPISTPSCVTTYSPLVELSASTSTATLQSHSAYPANYDNYYSYYWLIRKPDISDTLTFYFNAFNLEYIAGCSYDKLVVYDGSCVTDTVLYTLCGRNIDSDDKYTVELGRYVLFHMTTDVSVVYSGFEMVYYVGDNSSSSDDDSGSGLALRYIVIICIVSVVIIAASVITYNRYRRTKFAKTKPAPQAPPRVNIYDFKLTSTVKEKIPKPKGIHQKTTDLQSASNAPTSNQSAQLEPVTPATINTNYNTMHSTLPPSHLSDPAFPPQSNGLPPSAMHYTSGHPAPSAPNVPSPFVYKPPY